MVQWLRLHASDTGDTGSIPGGRTKILPCTEKKKKVRPKRVSKEVLAATMISSHSLCVALVAGSFLVTLPSTEAISLPDSYPGLGPGTLYLGAVMHEEKNPGQQTSQRLRCRCCPSF